MSSFRGTSPRGAGHPLAALGFDRSWVENFAPFRAAGLLPGRVSAVDPAAVDAVVAAGPVRATFGAGILQCIANDPDAGPCTGDWVALRAWPDGRTTLEAILPRRTTLFGGAAWGGARGQLVAANVDVVLVSVSLEQAPNLTRLQPMLTRARSSGAAAVVVLTKADLDPDRALRDQSLLAALLAVEVLVVSVVTSQPADRLSELAVPGRTVALIGEPGVGKSTLVNRLAGAHVAAVAQPPAHRLGRSRTARPELLILPTGALVVDTPGVRGYDLEEPPVANRRS